jgi:hypothetical protein
MAEQNSLVYIYYIFLIHSSVVRHLDCFQSLAIVNTAAINICASDSIISWSTLLQLYAQE